MKGFLILIIAALISAVSMTSLAEPAPMADADFNPFADAYVSHRPSSQGPHDAPRIHAGQDKGADHQGMLEAGFDLLGYSSFEAGDVPVEKLKIHAAAIQADVVLVYTEGLEKVPTPIRMQRAQLLKEHEAKGLPPPSYPDNEQFYDYFAAYWVKLPPPVFGAHVQRYTQGMEAPGGLEVLAVIKDSPAARTGLQQGDVLVRMGDFRLNQTEDLMKSVKQYAGQQVEIEWLRNDERQANPVLLGKSQ